MASSASSSRSVSPDPQIAAKKERKRKRKEAAAAAAVEDAVVEAPTKDDGADDQIAAKKEKKRKRKEAASEVVEEAPAKDDGSDDDEETKEKVDGEEDVPVLSHAERRRQKKEAKLAAALAKSEDADAEGAAVKKRKLKDGSSKIVASSQRKNSVWVGNMSFKTQQEDLRRFFHDVGGITRVNMPTKAPSGPGVRPENRGFAYVDFETPEAKAAAIALSEKPLLGRKLLIKDGDSFEGRPAATAAGELTLSDPALVHKTHSKTAQKILRAQKQPPASTLFMGNLGFETTEETIRQLLDAHRPGNKKGKNVSKDSEVKADKADAMDVEKDEEKATPVEAPAKTEEPKEDWIRQVRMGTFEDTGLCKGFAFIDFTSVENSTAALINPKNHHLNGRNLVVEYASPDAVRRGLNKVRPPGERTANQGKKRPHRTERLQARAALRGDAPAGEEGEGEDAPEVTARPKRPWEHKETTAPVEGAIRHKGPKSRPKPGAALALAQRESVAIVPSEGKKVKF